MFTNTGNLSFYLGIGFIFSAFIGLLIAYRLIKGSMETARVEKIIDLGKWFIASVAIVVGATIIADNFKEREQDIKEFEVFDKYVSTITEADGVEKRWQLAEYFSIVSPDGELRRSWERYKKVVEERRDDYLASKKKLEELAKIEQPTEEQKFLIINLQTKTEKYEEPLIPVQQAPIQQTPKKSVGAQEWLIIAGGDTTLVAAKDELKKALKISPQARIYKKGNMYRTVIPNFTSRTGAETQLARAKLEVNKDSYIVTLQGWCKSVEDGTEFSICSE